MATELPRGPSEVIRHELVSLRAEWYWFLLLGILLVVVGLNEESSPVTTVGFLSLLGGVALLVLKIVRRNQG